MALAAGMVVARSKSCSGSRIAIANGLHVEVDGTDVSSSLAARQISPDMCLWLAHDFTPGAHLVSFKCVALRMAAPHPVVVLWSGAFGMDG